MAVSTKAEPMIFLWRETLILGICPRKMQMCVH